MTAVVLCADGREDRPAQLVSRDVIWVSELCARPRQLFQIVPDQEPSLVLGIHRKHGGIGGVQSAVRRAGFEPLGVGIVDLDVVPDDEALKVGVEAAIARVSAFPGALPEQMKLLPDGGKTRRDLLTISPPRYVGAPAIELALCEAGSGCRICVGQCPVQALSWEGGRVTYDVNACVACGICVTACPTGATHNPAVVPHSIESEVSAAVAASAGPLGIRFRCRDSTVEAEQGWYQLEVPCTGMLTVGWLLAPTVLGAADVDAVSCSVGGCKLDNDGRLAAVLEDVNTVRNASVATKWSGNDLFGSRSSGRLIAEFLGSTEGALELPNSQVGSVTIDERTCTACEMCATICPTGALFSDTDARDIRIEFDPRLCVACGQCVTTCPEVSRGAISMARRFTQDDWRRGARVLRTETVPTCEICGGPVAPNAMLGRIQGILTDDPETMDLISRRCVNCRGR